MKYTQRYKIGFHQTDLNFNLKPYEFMYMAQDIATEHVASEGCGQLDLLKHDMAWMLVKQNVEFLKMPCNMQEVVMKTWHKGQTGPIFYRDYTVEDIDGNLLIRSTSIWVTVNVKSRSLQRSDNLMDGCLVSDDAIVDKSIKIHIPADAQLISETYHTVEYSDVDCNSHANNTSYLLWAFNALPFSLLKEHSVKSLQISYLNEARPQTKVRISLYSLPDGAYGIRMTDEESGKSLALITCTLRQ